MDINQIVSKLKNAHEQYEPVIEKRKTIISEEVELLLKFIEKIFSFSTKKKINGRECILIYVFPQNDRDLISDDVYLSPDGFITYQVFNKAAYLEIVQDATIENGYVKVPIHYFLETVPLVKILRFFEKRPSILIDRAFQADELNDKRKDLIAMLKEIL